MKDADGNVFEFLYAEGRSDVAIPVRMNGKRVGVIEPNEGGWRFVPIVKRFAGETLKTVADVQRSLIGESATA